MQKFNRKNLKLSPPMGLANLSISRNGDENALRTTGSGRSRSMTSVHSRSSGMYDEQPMSNEDEKCSQVLSYLFLGNEDIPTASNATEIFQEKGITHVINLAQELEEKSPTRLVNNIQFANYPINDTPDEDLVNVLHSVADYVEKVVAQSSSHKVFIHCKAGKSRSASAVIAYLILKLKKNYTEAFNMVKQARPTIDPNIGFIVVLMNLEKNL